MQWSEMTTPERVTAIQGLLTANPTLRDQDIGERLGASRDSISWYIRRNQIQRPLSGGDKRRKVKPPKPTPEQRRFVFGASFSATPTLPKDVDEAKFRPLSGSAPKLLHELGSRECHWPVALDGPALFCACHAESGRYCEAHTKTSGKLVPRLVFK